METSFHSTSVSLSPGLCFDGWYQTCNKYVHFTDLSQDVVPGIQCIDTAVTLLFICVRTTRRSKNSSRFRARRPFPDLWTVSDRKTIGVIFLDLEMLCHLTSRNVCNLNIGNRTLVGYILQLNQVAVFCTILPAGLATPADWSKPHFHLYLWRIKEQSRNLKAQCERILSSFFLLPFFSSSTPPLLLLFHLPQLSKPSPPSYIFLHPFPRFPPAGPKNPFPLNLEINFSSKLFPCSKRPLCFRLPNHFYLWFFALYIYMYWCLTISFSFLFISVAPIDGALFFSCISWVPVFL